MPFKIIAESTTSRITRTRGFSLESIVKSDARFIEMQGVRLYNIGLWVHIRDPKILAAFKSMQDKIRAIIGEDHFYTPADEFHITVVSFTSKKDDVPSQAFEEQREKDLLSYERALTEVSLMLLRLKFRGVMITENAVCLINDDDTALYSLRARIERSVREKGLPYQGAPNIVHSTLVRFLKPVSLEQRLAIWELFKEFQTEEFFIRNYVLAHLTTFGRFNSRTLSRILGTAT